MKVAEICSKYQIPSNLQQHMLRVTAVAEILTENWIGEKIDKKAIVLACFFHDIAKPMTFDLAKQAQFGMLPDEIAKLEKLQNHLKNKYGVDEHQATVKICEDIGLDPTAAKIVDNL